MNVVAFGVFLLGWIALGVSGFVFGYTKGLMKAIEVVKDVYEKKEVVKDE